MGCAWDYVGDVLMLREAFDRSIGNSPTTIRRLFDMGAHREADGTQYSSKGEQPGQAGPAPHRSPISLLSWVDCALPLSKLNRLTRCPCSNTLHTFNRSIPRQHPLPHLVALLAPEPPRHPKPLFTTQLRLDGTPRLLVYEALPDTHGRVGV